MISDDMIAEATAIVRAERKVKPDSRKREHERLTREISRIERRIASLTDAVAESGSGEERAPLLSKLKSESKQLGAMEAAQARLDPSVTALDERRWFAELEADVRAARDRLASGDLDRQTETIRAVLGGARVRVSSIEIDGKNLWQLRAVVDGQFLALSSDSKQKLAVKGNVTGVTVTPITAPTKAMPASPDSPVKPESPPAQPAPAASNAPPAGAVTK